MNFKAVWILIKKDYVVRIWCSDVFLVIESEEMNHLDVEVKMKFLAAIENMNRTKPLK